MRLVTLSVVLLIGLASPAWAGWDEGWDAYKHRDYATATREFMALAEQGDARAQVTLQIMEVFDEGGPKDLDKLGKWRKALPDADEFYKVITAAASQGHKFSAKQRQEIDRLLRQRKRRKENRRDAVRWFRDAANQGDTKAWTLLGSMYDDFVVSFYYGMVGFQQDHAKAHKWFRSAAEAGEVTAQKVLAFELSIQNRGTEAAYWRRKAAEQGDRWAQRSLGLSYSHGSQRDKVRAYMWLTLAVEQGARKAANARDALARRMNRAQIAEAKKLAQEWKEKHKAGEAQTAAVAPPPEPEGDDTPSCLRGATFGPITEGSPLFGRVEGVQVVDVEVDSLAWQVGLRRHHAVTALNGRSVRDLDEFTAAIRKAGHSLFLAIIRPGDEGAAHAIVC